MRQQTLYICRGLPASGKTTWARKRVDEGKGRIKRVSRDDLRAMVDNGTFSPEAEFGITKVRDAIILQLLLLGYSVIVDDTNIAPHTVETLLILAVTAGVIARGVEFTCPFQECIKRDELRATPVGAQVILDMYEHLNRVKSTFMDPFDKLLFVDHPPQEGLNVADIRTPAPNP